MTEDVIVSEVRGDGDEVHRLVRVDAWSFKIWEATGDNEPRIRDVDAAERLGFARVRDVRKLIKRTWPGKKINEIHHRATVARFSGQVAATPQKEYWLTEAQLLKLVARSETDIAEAILDDMIHVYSLVRRGLLLSAAPAPSLSQIRVDLHKFIGSATDPGQADEVRTAMAALDVMLSRRPGALSSQTRAPRPPAKMRRKAPRATAPKDPAFAARIQAILELRGWSSNKLGEAAGIGSGPISKLRRRGPAEAGGATLTKVADAAGVELRWLVTGEGPMTSSTLN